MDGIAPDMPTYKQQMTYNIGAVAAGLGDSKKKAASAPKDENIGELLMELQKKAEVQARRELEQERKAAAGRQSGRPANAPAGR